MIVHIMCLILKACAHVFIYTLPGHKEVNDVSVD